MKKVLLAVLVVLVLGAAGAATFWYLNEQRIAQFGAASFGTGTVIVTIPVGTNPKGVAKLLADAKVVSDAEDMYAWLRHEKLGPKLRAGEYEFTLPMTPQQAIDKVISGQVKLYRFTVPEGLRIDEILPILAGSELKLDLQKLNQLAATPAFVRKQGIPADSLEGFLLPDTYSFTRNATEEAVLAKMVSRAIEEYKHAPRKAGVTLDLLQTMTLASIVEKETGAVEERPRISCVFHERMRLGMKLQTDPTVIYAMMLLRGRYVKNITKADLTTSHPYNTYTMKGLPPGPIANAGTAAIRAALNPVECKDLFFVSKNDGTHVFCPDLKCHEANVDKFQRRGGAAKHTDDGEGAEGGQK